MFTCRPARMNKRLFSYKYQDMLMLFLLPYIEERLKIIITMACELSIEGNGSRLANSSDNLNFNKGNYGMKGALRK